LDRHQSRTLGQLINEANAELARRGFDYEFEVGSFIRKHKLTPLGGSAYSLFEDRPYEFDLRTVEGTLFRLQMDVSPAGECGERTTVIPVAHVTEEEIELVVNSRHYRVRRPSTFSLESMQLVDEKTKKSVRTWELPYYAQPVGVSPDGSTLYFNIYSSYPSPTASLRRAVAPISRPAGLQILDHPWEVTLAVSGRGIQIANAYEWIKQEKSEMLEDRDPKSSYAGYKRFNVGDRTYVVRFLWPCT
jgi:hypothetical protein